MTLVILFGHRRVFNNYKYTNRQSSYLCASWNPHLFTLNKKNKGLKRGKKALKCESQIHQLLINTEKDLTIGETGIQGTGRGRSVECVCKCLQNNFKTELITINHLYRHLHRHS